MRWQLWCLTLGCFLHKWSISAINSGTPGKVFVVDAPACAGERLLNFTAAYSGSYRREQFYWRTQWAIDLLRGLHERALESATSDIGEAAVFYVPAFFALLIAIHDDESLACLTKAAAALTSSSLYWRNVGYDHFYLHGLEYPVVTDFDYALGVGRPPQEAKDWMVQAFYASTQNMVMLATGELSQGTLSSAINANLYSMRRIVTVPFLLQESCMDQQGSRIYKLSFAGSVQAYNYERALFVRAAAAEFANHLHKRANGLVWAVDDPKRLLWAMVQMDPNSPSLNHTQRNIFNARRRWLTLLYQRSEL
eukprot:TRINITY_DN110486_c0_g1_i1.p1 TRINITY_DN110486_c0_g1~~TRINITY_DN110486_c0_g1_i1.p1  ORF type:complete len:308 (+),score=55.46 TRINITY_DN110486_c0_g1_i1:1-924(+)